MTSDHAEAAPTWPADDVSVEELAGLQGVEPVTSVDDMAHPEVFGSDQEWEAFLADLYASRRADLARGSSS
ncbi:hypothetical protein MF406_10455 [Georgenia sp. TF02-10]|uniref:hypothetical protein n=1 Tax=Georgenia sp. TF02-10 TaxID=2917725 RepID=UPI001FA7E0E6|nr:hypothetical protein [Georgenia sp. TF02-10]UNX53425.1 hypothetical protein MF406_10455 [Georgenia sp. TF02-10]